MTTHQSTRPPPLKDVPDVVFDSIAKTYYSKGKFLGKGGFARCYELIDLNTNRIYAGKVVSKTLLANKHQKVKVCTYIFILYGFITFGQMTVIFKQAKWFHLFKKANLSKIIS